MRGTLCYFDLFLRSKGWGSDKVRVLQKGFHVAVSGCPPPALLQPLDVGQHEGPQAHKASQSHFPATLREPQVRARCGSWASHP